MDRACTQISTVPGPANIIAAPAAICLIMILVMLAFSNQAFAQQDGSAGSESDWIQLHGYGNWSAGYSDENHFMASAEPEGNWDRISSALVVHASPYQNLHINTSTEFTVTGENLDIRLNFAFAEWVFSDALRLRIGQPKHPFSLYSEVFQVGTLRPFILLPTSVYGPSGVIAEFYRGVGVTGSLYTDSGWTVSYDLYVGDMDIPEYRSWDGLDDNPPADGEEEIDLNEDTINTLGARITLEPPMGGLVVGVSGFTGEVPEEDARRICLGAYIEYIWNYLTLRGEYNRLMEIKDAEVEEAMNSFYLEASFKPTEWLQIAGMYGMSKFEEDSQEEIPDSLFDHQEIAVGLNYLFNPNFILKLSYHYIIGNRYAHPSFESLGEVIEAGELNENTHVLFFGGAFSF